MLPATAVTDCYCESHKIPREHILYDTIHEIIFNSRKKIRMKKKIWIFFTHFIFLVYFFVQPHRVIFIFLIPYTQFSLMLSIKFTSFSHSRIHKSYSLMIKRILYDILTVVPCYISEVFFQFFFLVWVCAI